jgi:methionyl-tRNA formyltransferase
MPRVIFMGTPDFAVPSLQALVAHSDFDVVGVVTQPDRPAGRGRELTAPPVKRAAEAHGIPIYQPATLRTPEAVDPLAAWQPDVIVVAAFGQILRPNVLELPPYGCVNVHASLLPRWRGAAPIQYAIRAGDEQTGITIMRMDAGLDTGPMIEQRAILIEPDETGASLHDKLAALGAKLLPDVLVRYLRGELPPVAQPEDGVTLAPTLDKGEGQIDWTEPAAAIDRQVRAYTPWPGTFSYLEGELIKVVAGRPLSHDPGYPLPGTLIAYESGLAVQTGEGLYLLQLIQPAGKKPMTGQAFLAGHPESAGKVLGMPNSG